MKRFYLRFRIVLMTFALGLASVFVYNGSLKYSEEVPVNLPKTKTGEILVVMPEEKCHIWTRGGGGGGSY